MRLHPLLFVFISIICLFSLHFQSNPKKEPDYFPLRVGQQWKYYTWGNLLNEQIVTVTEYSPLHNAYIITQVDKIGMSSLMETRVLLDKRSGGIVELGSEGGLLNSDWEFYTKTILKYPLRLNQTWANKSDYMTTSYTVVGFQDLSVQAGHFSHVCKVRSVTKEKGKSFGLTQFEYYAPNIGLIRKEFMNGGKSVIFRELTGYTE